MPLSAEDRRRRGQVIGQAGRGKTTVLKSCIFWGMHVGAGFAFIDRHGELSDEIVDSLPRSRTHDIVYFKPSDTDYPISLNPLGHVPP